MRGRAHSVGQVKTLRTFADKGGGGGGEGSKIAQNLRPELINKWCKYQYLPNIYLYCLNYTFSLNISSILTQLFILWSNNRQNLIKSPISHSRHLQFA